MKHASKFLVLLSLAAAPAWAVPSGDEMKKIDRTIRDLTASVDGMIEGIEIEIRDQEVSFPEYEGVYSDFLGQVRRSSASFKEKLVEIRDTVSVEISREYSELAAVEKLAAKGESDGLDELLRDKQARVVAKKREIQGKINELYQTGISELFSLQGKLLYPLGRKSRPAPKFYATLGFVGVEAVLMGTVFGLPAAGIINGTIGWYIGLGWMGGLTLSAGNAALWFGAGCSESWDCSTWTRQTVRYNNGEYAVSRKDRTHVSAEDVEAMQAKAGKKVFATCETAGCVYLMAENYSYWHAEVEKRVNRNVKLVEGLKLDEVDTRSSGAAAKGMKKIARLTAAGLPIGKFDSANEKLPPQ